MTALPESTVSVLLPTYQREEALVNTLRGLLPQLEPGDEIVVIDQTPVHEPATEQALRDMARARRIRWFRKRRPSQAEALNVGAQLATGAILVILDDDIVPGPTLLKAHRGALTTSDPPPATCGQVLQPWNATPLDSPGDLALGFNAAYARPCEILSLQAGNFAMRRDTFIRIGGMDENFIGSNYRNDAELAHRIVSSTGQRIRFVPEASVRHLLLGGGNRAFGGKDTWGHIGGSIGDYYFALKWLPPRAALLHALRRFLRAPLNRNTVRRPWLIPSLALREAVAAVRAVARLLARPRNYIKDVTQYSDLAPAE